MLPSVYCDKITEPTITADCGRPPSPLPPIPPQATNVNASAKLSKGYESLSHASLLAT